VQVETKEKTVILRGSVRNVTARRAAEKDAYNVQGIQNVENNLRVKNTGTLVSDNDIAKHVENMISWNNNIMSTTIHVNSREGVVTLEGSVDTYWEKTLAEEIAISSKGVVDVKNNISVEVKEESNNEEIKEDILKAYQRNPLIADGEIKVSVNNGNVDLSGHVSSYAIKNQAITIAHYTRGVKDVKDNITLG
jgi:osmotically-inducible protein OsmY